MWLPLLFLLTSVVTPGPLGILTVHHSIKYGRSTGVAVAIGGTVTTAAFVAVALAVAANRSISQLSLETVWYQQVGAVILLALGIHAGYSCVFGTRQADEKPAPSGVFLKGVLAGMVLMVPYFPQVILFYTVIVPKFATVSNPASISQIGMFEIAFTFVWFCALAFTAQKIQKRLFHARLQRLAEFAVACFFVATGIAILV